jgi:AhpD family alkylhydroperoxidase
MKKARRYVLAILFAVATGGALAQRAGTDPDGTEAQAIEAKRVVPDISLSDLKLAVAESAVVLIDCNGSESYAASHIPGAIDFEAAGSDLAKQLPQNKAALIVAYCAGPKCLAYKAGVAAAAQLGYTNVKYFPGGITGWNKKEGTEGAFAQRLNFREASPAAFEAMAALSKPIKNAGFDPELISLVLMRASQLNGCAWCLNLHTKDAKTAGTDAQRLNLLPVWREVPVVYTERQMAALAWTEAITLIADKHVPDEVYETARTQFTEKELVDLTTVIIAINGWNRLNIAFQTPVMCDVK